VWLIIVEERALIIERMRLELASIRIRRRLETLLLENGGRSRSDRRVWNHRMLSNRSTSGLRGIHRTDIVGLFLGIGITSRGNRRCRRPAPIARRSIICYQLNFRIIIICN
jgi:hypothetical protein